MKTLSSYIVVAALIMLASCDNSKETPSGFKYQFVSKSSEPVAKVGQILVMDLCIKDSKDSAWYDNRKSGFPDMVIIRDSSFIPSEHGIAEVFRALSKGDSVKLPMAADDMFMHTWRMTRPNKVDPKTVFTFYLKVTDVLDSAAAVKLRTRLDSVRNEELRIQSMKEQEESARRQAEAIEHMKVQLGKDITIIDNYLKEKNIKAIELPSGLRYQVRKNGEGRLVKNGDYAVMKYTGSLLNGEIFDEGEYTFAVGSREVIDGWDQIALQMKKGMAITVYIPSPLGYGPYGSGPKIMGDAVLVFEMELLNINPN